MTLRPDLERLLTLHSEAQRAADHLAGEITTQPWADHYREPLAVLCDTLGHQASLINELLTETE